VCGNRHVPPAEPQQHPRAQREGENQSRQAARWQGGKGGTRHQREIHGAGCAADTDVDLRRLVAGSAGEQRITSAPGYQGIGITACVLAPSQRMSIERNPRSGDGPTSTVAVREGSYRGVPSRRIITNGRA
jgi:hypothetical protein